ncbi:MAG: Gfo/Idh/MocA family protein [Lentisphaeria bacterium]|jgi:predicted dehydrogenase
MAKLRYGIIGTGGAGQGKHLASYAQNPDVELIAVCDIIAAKANQAADRFNVEAAYTDYKEMLREEKLDLVSVATPNHVHAPATIAALQAGCHVHCEKPASLTPALVRSMIAARDKSGKKLMIGLNNRFTNWAQFSKAFVEAGSLGEIYHAKCGWKRRRGIPGKGGWFTTKAQSGGGPLIDLGVHFIDVSNYIMGFPKPVTASGQTYSKFADGQPFNPKASGYTGTYDVEDLAVGFVRYENGCTLDLEFSWASNIESEYSYVELYGTKAGLKIERGQVSIFQDFNGTSLDSKAKLKPEGAWGMAECLHYTECIRKNQEPIARPEECVLIMEIINALYKSAEKNAEVKIKL